METRYAGRMPLYEYRCRDCGHDLERVQPMGAGPPGACPECGGELRRRYSRVAVRFQGWGFSTTDDLLSDERRAKRDFKEVQRKAEELRDS